MPIPLWRPCAVTVSLGAVLFSMLLLFLTGPTWARAGVRRANHKVNAARVTMIRPASIPPLIASDGSYDYVSDHGGYHSPDGRYLAEILGGDAVIRRLRVSRLIRRGGRIRRQVLFAGLDSLNTIAWMPGLKDTLVASTGGEDNGVGLLAEWDPAHRLRILKRTKQDEGEGFTVLAVTTDGRFVRYLHFGVIHVDNYHVIHTLKLPPGE